MSARPIATGNEPSGMLCRAMTIAGSHLSFRRSADSEYRAVRETIICKAVDELQRKQSLVGKCWKPHGHRKRVGKQLFIWHFALCTLLAPRSAPGALPVPQKLDLRATFFRLLRVQMQ